MTTYSLSDMATRVLKDLGLVGADETPTASDLEWAEETCKSEIQRLNVLNMPIWNGSEVSIPEAYLTVLSQRIGLAIGPSFGLFSLAEAVTGMATLEKDLRRMATVQPTGAIMQAEYF